uniref:Uncharacterized protein n=1 Tax=Plectus sambesii TaxID=2011161 RepID=A0A914WEF6_9BILA
MKLLLLAVCVFVPLASSFVLPEGDASNTMHIGIVDGESPATNGQLSEIAALFMASDADKTALKECFVSFNVSCLIAIIDEKISNLTDDSIKVKLTAVRDQLTSVVSIFDNLSEDEKKILKSHDWAAIDTLLQGKCANITDEDQRKKAEEFFAQLKAMHQGREALVRPQGGMFGNGAFPVLHGQRPMIKPAFPMFNGEMPLVKPAFEGGPSADVMPVDGHISGGRPHSLVRPMIFTNQASDNLDGSSALDGVRPLIGKIGVVDNNQQKANADLIRPIAPVGGGQDSVRIAARRRRRFI